MAIAVPKRPLPPHLVRPHALESLVGSDGTIDWSPWYLTEEEDMGQSGEQGDIIEVLASSLEVLAGERGWSVRVGKDNFFAWVEGQPKVQVSPDIYLLDLLPPSDEPLPRRWETWRVEHGPPRLALEIVSSEWKKDYDINPPRYDHLGVAELVLADAEAVVRDLTGKGRAPFVVYRRSARDRLELAYRGEGPALCDEIDAYLYWDKSHPARPRVRISRDPEGSDLVPTVAEKAMAAEDRAKTAEDKAEAQAAEIAALQARLQALEGC